MLTIDVIICTINAGINSVPDVLMPPLEGVRYVVSVQYTSEYAAGHSQNSHNPIAVPQILEQREDVIITFLEGKGLSRNRNNGVQHATADIVVIADDDCRYEPLFIERIRKAYEEHGDAGAILFASESYDGASVKRYPQQSMPYAEACRHGYFVSSIEMTFRRSAIEATKVRFNERFGLGSGCFGAGEEDVLLKDFTDAGMQVMFVPEVIVRSEGVTTGSHFLESADLQQTKGAVFRYVYGTPSALWRTIKEGGWYLIHRHVNPFPIIFNMLRGICR